MTFITLPRPTALDAARRIEHAGERDVAQRASRAAARVGQFDALRITAAFGTVLAHSCWGGANATSPRQVGFWTNDLFYSSCRWVVPAFVMLAGALLLGPRPGETAPQFYRKRLAYVLRPWLIWCGVYALWAAWLAGGRVDVKSLIVSLDGGGPCFHLYFLPLIAGLYLLTPPLRELLAPWDRKQQLTFAGMALALAAAEDLRQHVFPYMVGITAQFLPYVGYYVAGYALRDVRLTRNGRWLAWSSFLLALLAATLANGAAVHWLNHRGLVTEFQSKFAPTSIVMGLSIFIAIGDQLRDRTWLRHPAVPFVARSMFGVYLAHMLLVTWAMQHGWLWPDNAHAAPLRAAVVFAATTAVIIPLRRLPYARLVLG